MIKEPENTNENANQTEEAEKKPKKKESKEVKELKEIIKAKETELSDANDKYLRLLAEYDNFKKRTAKEKEAIYIDSVGDTVTKLLPLVDNFERAMLSFTEKDKESDFYKGIEMIFNQTLDTFTKLGVTPIPSLGEEFNPEFHNAVMHIEDENVADNIIVEEFQKGYTFGGRVIRHSMVKVAN